MYKQLNISMDTIFLFKCTLIGQENIFLLIKLEITIVETSIGTTMNWRNWVLHLGLHHLNPPSFDSKLTSKGKLGKNTKCSKGTKGCRLKYMQIVEKMDYSLLVLQFIPFQCIQGIPYIVLQNGNGGLNLSVLKAFGRPRVKLFRLLWGKIQKYLDLCTHPDVRRFEVKSCMYTRVWD